MWTKLMRDVCSIPLNSLWVLDWICWDWATVLMSSWITTRSWFPASLQGKKNTHNTWNPSTFLSTTRTNCAISQDYMSCLWPCWHFSFWLYVTKYTHIFSIPFYRSLLDIGFITFIITLPWVDLQVVVAGYCVNLNFLFRGSLESK